MVVETPQDNLDLGDATLQTGIIEGAELSVSSLVVGDKSVYLGDLGVTGNSIMSSNLTVSGNVTVSSNLEVGTSKLVVSSNVGIGTSVAQHKLHVNGDMYAHGVVVQSVIENVHDIVTYPATLDNHLEVFDITIKPKSINSKILLHWNVCAEIIHDRVYRIYRDNELIGYNNTVGVNHWNGIAAGLYDLNFDNTMANMNIKWVDEPKTTNFITYKLYTHDANNSSFQAVYVNRTEDGGGGDDGNDGLANIEIGVSYKSALELAQ